MNLLYERVKNILSPIRRSGIFRHDYLETSFSYVSEYLRINKLEGDFAEFGTYTGLTFSYWYNNLKNCKVNTFFAFDSFEGLSTPLINEQILSKKQYSCDRSLFLNNIKKLGVPLSKVETVKGYFNESLKREKVSRIKNKFSVVHIDCDLYEPSVDVLEYIKDKIIDGGIIIFNDWYLFKASSEAGERKAFFEFVKNNNIKYSEFPTLGLIKGFIIHKEKNNNDK